MEVVSPTDPNRLRVTAAQNFVDKLNSSKDKVGVVSWNGCGSEGGSYVRNCDTDQNEVDQINGYLTSAQFELQRGSQSRNSMQINPIQFSEPMTKDMALVKKAIGTVNSDGLTNPDLGLKVAMDLLDKGATSVDGERVIVFLTDGQPRGTSNGRVNSLTDIGVNCDKVTSPAYAAMQKGYKIYAVGLGGGDIRPEDEARLQRWAQCTGGTYQKATNAAALAGIYDKIYSDVKGNAMVKRVCREAGIDTKSIQAPLPTPSPTLVPTFGPTRIPTPSPTNAPTPSPTRNPTPQPTNTCFTSGKCCDSNPNGCCSGLTCKSSSMWSSSKTCQ
ncbi:cytochrome c [Nitzschia inconspicua]|uniref:Cytochrome c n=1 Tax=Nitzschia inconspicua TaxID=303405 RepID=A0A9K3M2R1_9STRA|nr:cytochrome c [Nitzschia inconspicua]